MDKDLDLNSLDGSLLLSLAIYANEFNMDFFRSWANRMRTYDLDAVEFLHELAEDAKRYLDTLYLIADKPFEGRLPELDLDLYKAFTLQLQLPQNRYFIVFAEEASRVLVTALSLQQKVFALLAKIDDLYETRFQDYGVPHLIRNHQSSSAVC